MENWAGENQGRPQAVSTNLDQRASRIQFKVLLSSGSTTSVPKGGQFTKGAAGKAGHVATAKAMVSVGLPRGVLCLSLERTFWQLALESHFLSFVFSQADHGSYEWDDAVGVLGWKYPWLPQAPQTAASKGPLLLINALHLQPPEPCQIPLPRVQARARPPWFRVTEQFPTNLSQPATRSLAIQVPAPLTSPDAPRPVSLSRGAALLEFRVPWTRKISKTHLGTDIGLPTFSFARKDT